MTIEAGALRDRNLGHDAAAVEAELDPNRAADPNGRKSQNRSILYWYRMSAYPEVVPSVAERSTLLYSETRGVLCFITKSS